jgi:hypothetical protein
MADRLIVQIEPWKSCSDQKKWTKSNKKLTEQMRLLERKLAGVLSFRLTNSVLVISGYILS